MLYLNLFFQIERNMRPLVVTTCLAFILLVALCSQIVLKCHYKLPYGFILFLLVLHSTKLIEFSDVLEDHNQEIQALLYFDSPWYRKSRNFRFMVRQIVVQSVRSEHYSFFGGLIVFDRPLLLALWNNTYTFVNWLIYLNSH